MIRLAPGRPHGSFTIRVARPIRRRHEGVRPPPLVSRREGRGRVDPGPAPSRRGPFGGAAMETLEKRAEQFLMAVLATAAAMVVWLLKEIAS